MHSTALLGLGFLISAAAHSCNDGQRVTCMAVQLLPADMETRSHGYGARGLPHCTPEGQKLYCLVNHDYHGCSQDHQPCCRDGSNPWHHGRGGGDDSASDDLTCTKEGVMLLKSEASPPVSQVILDDMDIALNTQGVNAHEGTYAPCLKDAYNKQFHHDWARNKGVASFSFPFEAPQSGCYKLEEHHPGGDWMCARYLPRNAKLDVEHFQGQVESYVINQAVKGGQWNEVGSLMFLSDQPGKLTMYNSPDEQCSGSQCFWIADAFRLTWTGKECSSSTLRAQDELEENVDDDKVGSTSSQNELPENSDDSLVKTVPTDSHIGMLKLQLDLSHGHTHNQADLALKLKGHQDLLETTLAVHFNFKNVWILDFGIATRRLSETRSINIRFAGQGTRSPVAAPTPSSLGLKGALQKSLTAADAGVTIMGADVEWNTSRSMPSDDDSQPGSTLIVLLTVGIFSGLACVAAAGWYFIKAKGLKTKAVVKNGSAAPEELGRTIDVLTIEEGTKPEHEKSAEDALEVLSVDSTRSPASDAVPSEDASSNEDRHQDLLHGSDAVEVTV